MSGINGKATVRELAGNLAGSLLYSVGLYSFASGGEFAPGGISGIALLISDIFPLPVGAVVLFLNIPLILLSLRFLGKRFLLRTLVSGLFATFFLDIVLPGFPVYDGKRTVSAVGAGLFIGLGLVIYYSQGTSSGGIDLVTLSIRAEYPKLRLGLLMFLLDLPIIGAGYFVYGDGASVVFGLLATGIESTVVELFGLLRPSE